MWIGFSEKKFWEFTNNQKLLLKDAEAVGEYPDKSKKNVTIWAKLDDRYNLLTKKFSGLIHISHLKFIIPVSKTGKDSLDQLYSMFPEIKKVIRREDG
ncbi:MAG: hypothetical protein IT276_04830 [Ignavibacteriaceae bacterium]|nr:hypothetical protein [Ignavibacteriaceae bacterium]